MCSTTSPCGEKIPGAGRSPEYYLLLEASNRLASKSSVHHEITQSCSLYSSITSFLLCHPTPRLYDTHTHTFDRENGTYCALSVQFTIKLHGLSMGGITTVVSLIVCSLSPFSSPSTSLSLSSNSPSLAPGPSSYLSLDLVRLSSFSFRPFPFL